jgi:hypothetical protein
MERRQRRSGDVLTALHLFLESKLDAGSLRVTTARGDLVAAVGDDAYADDWIATSEIAAGEDLVVASSGGRIDPDVAPGVRRIIDAI